MNSILEHFFHRHSYDPTKWNEVGSVNVYEDDDDLTTWLYTVGQKQKDRKIIEIRKTYTNTCLACGHLETKTVCL
jgi:hypothetical protein